MRSDHGEQVPRLHPVRGEDHDDCLSQACGNQTTDEGVAPDVDGWIGGGPATRVVAETDLEWEINEHRQSHVLLAETFVEQLEVRDGVVGLKADLGDQVYNDDALDVLELENADHASVHVQHTVLILCLLFTFQDDQGCRDDEVCPPPEGEITTQRHDTFRGRRCSKPPIGKVRGAESQEDRVRKKMTGRQTYSLRSRGIGKIGRGKEGEGPAIYSNILCGA